MPQTQTNKWLISLRYSLDHNCKTKKKCDERHPKLCRKYVSDQNCTYGEDCKYLHEDSEKITEGKKLKKIVEELENIRKGKSLAENKMEVAEVGNWKKW